MSSVQMTDPVTIREFVFAGNARLTLVSRRTGTRFTYRVRTADGDGPAYYFVKVLTGPVCIGLYRCGRGCYDARSYKQIGANAPSAMMAWRWFDHYVLDGSRAVEGGRDVYELPAELEVWHEGRCGACGRALTDPESIARGIGPTCARKS